MNSQINISCFGAIRPLKNHLTQAAAAIQFADNIGKSLNFYINHTHQEQQQSENILKNLRAMFNYQPNHKLIEIGWLPHEDFVNYIRNTIDIGMQVSFTETYNIVAADHIFVGVPIITSHEVKFVLPFYKCSPTNINEIVSKLDFAYHTKCLKLHNINKLLLKYSNSCSVYEWKRNLDEIDVDK